MQTCIKLEFKFPSGLEVSEISKRALAPLSSAVIFINVNDAAFAIVIVLSCNKRTSFLNISGNFRSNSRPSVEPVTPLISILINYKIHLPWIIYYIYLFKTEIEVMFYTHQVDVQ